MAIFPSIPILSPIQAVLCAAYLLALASPMVLAAYLRALAPVRLALPAPLPLYACVLAILGGMGIAVLEAPVLLAPVAGPTWLPVAALGLAPALGWAAFHIEHRFHLRQRRAGTRTATAALPRMEVRAVSPWTKTAAAAPPVRRRAILPIRATPRLMALIALLEEVLFRAVMISFLIALLPAVPAALIVALCCVWFSLAHVQFGIAQVWLKLPLSLFATLLYLVGGVAAAALAHIVFNVLAVRQQQRHASDANP